MYIVGYYHHLSALILLGYRPVWPSWEHLSASFHLSPPPPSLRYGSLTSGVLARECTAFSSRVFPSLCPFLLFESRVPFLTISEPISLMTRWVRAPFWTF